MKTLSFIFSLWFAWVTVPGPNPIQVKGDYAPIAVLELFTSQGCSSCPPADALLNRIVNEKHNAKIIGLSFHVSYWNHLGWTDPYSNDAFSKRQYWYNSKFTTGVYTPQVIANGSSEYVGSNQLEANTKIKEALTKPATVAIDLTLTDSQLSYHLAGQYANTVLNIAAVQKEAKNYVKSGENSGRSLVHNNVVLSFSTRKSTEHGEIPLKLPPNTSSVVVYVQNTQTGEVVGVTQIDALYQ